ncbi:MAG: hypothetical protein ACRYFX_11490 [Janthinobacterium lividum]
MGYQLGFQNRSHFTRLFERQVGRKPEQDSKRRGTRPRPKGTGS